MRQDNRGITLVEIIVAVSVSVIVIVASSFFVRNAVQSYRLATAAIDLQIEAQVLMEQFATWIMEGNYVDDKAKDSSGNEVFVIYHIPREASENLPTVWKDKESELMGERWMRVFWFDDRKLYMYKAGDDSGENFLNPTDAGSRLDSSIWTDKSKWHLLSNYVEELTMETITDINGLPNKVTVTLTMKAGIQSYVLTDEFNIRNTSHVPVTESPSPTVTLP